MQNYNTKNNKTPKAKRMKANKSKNYNKKKIKTLSLSAPIYPAEEDCACGSMKSKKVIRNAK